MKDFNPRRTSLAKEMYLLAGIVALTSVLLLFFRVGRKDNEFIVIITLVSSAYAGIASLFFSSLQRKIRGRKKVFIIYSGPDLPQAKKISEALKTLGFSTWLDGEQIMPGMRWQAAIERALEDSSSALILNSSSLDLTDERVAREISVAMKIMRSKDELFSPVIPLTLDESPVPEFLKDVCGAKINSEEDIQSLARSLERVLQGT
jgi:hypothetical protein